MLDLCEITLKKVAAGRMQTSIGTIAASFIFCRFWGQLGPCRLPLKLPFIDAVSHVQEVVFGHTGALLEDPFVPLNLKLRCNILHRCSRAHNDIHGAVHPPPY